MKPDYVVDWKRADAEARNRMACLSGSHRATPGKPLSAAQTRKDVQATIAALQKHDPRLKGLKVCLLNKPEGRLLAGIASTRRRDVDIRQRLGELTVHLGTF